MNHKYFLGIDFGTARFGLAVSKGMIAQPYSVLQVKNIKWKKIIEQLQEIIVKLHVTDIVIGLPLGMQGQKTLKSIQVEKFALTLKQELVLSFLTKITIHFEEERFTSKIALKVLHFHHIFGSKTKQKLDSTAACVILDSFLRKIKN